MWNSKALGKAAFLKKKILILYDTLMVPVLTCNFRSMFKAAENGKITVFSEIHYEIQDDKGNVAFV